MIISFYEFLILEEKKKSSSVGSDPKGKLHELLVGYHLRGGKHMERHPDDNKKTPKEVHDEIKSAISSEDYDQINDRAKAAADHIRKHIESSGHNIETVHWTSKAGDIERSTGVPSTQKEDASDIIVHSRDKKKKRIYHGVSLKVTDKGSKDLPVSNPGMETTYGGQSLLERHRKRITERYPRLNIKNKAERKAIVKGDPKLREELKSMHSHALNEITDHLHKHLSGMNKKELADHIRNHVLASNKTPLQNQGHHHIRHTTYSNRDGSHAFHAIDPHEYYENILRDHENLSVEKKGASIVFKHKGKAFARHRLKFESQSDPMSIVKGSGEPVSSNKKSK